MSRIPAETDAASLPQLGAIDRFKIIAKSTAKRGIDVCFASKVAVLRAIGLVDFPVPPNSRLRRTSSLTLRHYYESGLTTMMPIHAMQIRTTSSTCGTRFQRWTCTPMPSILLSDIKTILSTSSTRFPRFLTFLLMTRGSGSVNCAELQNRMGCFA